ncbi:MAG: ATP-binding protein [Bacteroidales bacterium]|nr:ATP-binding protein [Bacteroidales bacterium]
MKIVISGTYSTGKTTTALALSLLTGIPVTHARTMREILPTAFPGKRLEKCDFHELMELGMRRFTERIITEKEIGNSFISDGCPLQEWIYGTTRMTTGLNPAEKPWKIKLHKAIYNRGWNVFSETINGFGCIAKEYTKKHYDKIIHLPVEFPFNPDGHRPTSELFRQKSEILLKKTYTELGLEVFEVKGSLEERLNKIITHLELSPILSTKEAIITANKIKENKFDSIKIETETAVNKRL